MRNWRAMLSVSLMMGIIFLQCHFSLFWPCSLQNIVLFQPCLVFFFQFCFVSVFLALCIFGRRDYPPIRCISILLLTLLWQLREREREFSPIIIWSSRSCIKCISIFPLLDQQLVRRFIHPASPDASVMQNDQWPFLWWELLAHTIYHSIHLNILIENKKNKNKKEHYKKRPME